MNEKQFSTPIDLNNITLRDDFWTQKQELVRREVIPYQYNALHDHVPGAEKSYCIENFIKAGKIAEALKKGEEIPVYPADKWCYDDRNADENAFHGWVFQDSDVYKWIEAVGYSLINRYDSALAEQAKDVIRLICAAQLENGYLDTLYIINNRNEIFSNLKDFHELYCFGHLAEAAVSFYRATRDRMLLDAALRFADLICDTFGEDKIKGYPGHEIAEMALVKLYDLTGKKKYLDMAAFFVEERGKKPYYYDLVLGKTTVNDNYHYNQAHCQPKFQTEAVGHAVRGVYLYSGMADLAMRKRDEALLHACHEIWNNIENKKLYITGGIGATADGEAFSFDYDLPNDLAYSETCASIGLIFFARRMSEIEPNSRYADVAERALYNTVLSGMAEDGKSFFYVNPLEVLPEASAKDSRKRHVKPVRQKWFGCACCPPNLARLLSSLGEYCFTENDTAVFVHQYIGARIQSGERTLDIQSDYLESGSVHIKTKAKKPFTLALRIPGWCDKFTLNKPYIQKNGYAHIEVQPEDCIDIRFDNRAKLMQVSNSVRADIGKVAVTKGPLVYCVEAVDNGNDLQMLRLKTDTEFEKQGEFLIADGFREAKRTALYSEYKKAELTPCKIKLLPYYRWGNRGENEMSVFISIKESP